MPIILGPQLAALLPAQDVEPLGDYLLEGIGRHCTLFAPIGWADLTAVDSNWAASAAGKGERHDIGDWSRWGEVARFSAGARTTGTRLAFRRHGA